MTTKSFLYTILLSIILVSCKQTNEELVNEGVHLAKQKKYKEAIKFYTKAINQNNKLQLAYYDRGFSFTGLKDYPNALNDFNKVLSLQTHGDFIFTENPNSPFASEEARMQVPYNDALYQRALVKYYMDSIESSFHDFQKLINENYEKSNCLLWQGSLLIKNGNTKKACECFENAKQFAINNDDTLQANEMIKIHCTETNNNR